MKARENRSDVESEDPIEVDDMIFSEEEESREIVVTSMKHRDPTAMSAGGEQEAERRGDVPMSRKHAVSADTAGEQEVKRARSPCPLVASLVSSPPAAGAAKQARRSEERSCTCVSPGPVPAV